jgi:hypothetical protein
LTGWVNADHGQVPVEFRRMKAGHLFEDGENCRLLFPGHRPFQKLRDGAFVGLHVRWKPERRAFEAGEVVRAVMIEGPTCKRPDEFGKVLQVMRRFWIHPARDGIRSESGDDRCYDGRFNGSGCDVDERRAAAIGSRWLEDEVGQLFVDLAVGEGDLAGGPFRSGSCPTAPWQAAGTTCWE